MNSYSRLLLIFIVCWLLHPSSAFSGSKEPAAVCLTDCSQIPSEIKTYTEKRPLKTEMDEINYLLARIRNSNLTFVRNGIEYNSLKAATFLRMKLMWYQRHHGEKIDDDEKFVAKVLKGSETTGEPYRVILRDGKRVNLQLVMFNELKGLEAYEGEKQELLISDLHIH
jgi:hypothetical protein